MRQPPPPRVRHGSVPSPAQAPVVHTLPVTPDAPAAPASDNVAISMTPRIEERHRAERRARARKTAIVVGSTVLVGALGWIAFFSPLFALHLESATIELHGDGATVKWGDATESDLKAAVLQTLRQVGASTYDVSAPRSPVTS